MLKVDLIGDIPFLGDGIKCLAIEQVVQNLPDFGEGEILNKEDREYPVGMEERH